MLLCLSTGKFKYRPQIGKLESVEWSVDLRRGCLQNLGRSHVPRSCCTKISSEICIPVVVPTCGFSLLLPQPWLYTGVRQRFICLHDEISPAATTDVGKCIESRVSDAVALVFRGRDQT